jgi:hypothetical protein
MKPLLEIPSLQRKRHKQVASILGWVGLGMQVVAQYLLAYHPITALWVMLLSGLAIMMPAMIVTKNWKMLVMQVIYTYFRIRTLLAWS